MKRIALAVFACFLPAGMLSGGEIPGLQVGVNIHWASGEILDRIPEMQMGWVRTGVGWAYIEPEFHEPPEYDWTTADKIVAANRDRGINILWGVTDTPSWASSNGAPNGVPKDAVAREHFRLFVRALAERYRDDINYFEIWNEPNLETFWTGSVEEYVDYLLVPAYEEVKAANPQNKIVGPGLALARSARISVENFFRRLAWKGAAQYIDILSQHVYEDEPGDVVRQFEKGDYECLWFICWKRRTSLYNIYRWNGFGNHPIWVTEFGWSSSKVGEKRQANFIVGTLQRLSARPRFAAAFIYELQDDDRFPQRYGLIRGDGTPKVVYYKLREGYLTAAEEDESCDFNEDKNCIEDPPLKDQSKILYIDY